MPGMVRLRARSTPLRKGLALADQMLRTLTRLRAVPEDYRRTPPVLANSFPKSGTHLLLQILRALPETRYYGSFIASMPTITFRERSREAHLRRISWLVPGEVVPAHLFHDADYAEALRARSSVHYFIYRDLRDVAVSEAHYLTYMNRWHRLHPYFAKTLGSDEERLTAVIQGIREPSFRYDYPDIASRFARYAGWLAEPDVMALRYEDLMSERREETLRAIVDFYAERRPTPFDREACLERIRRSIDPARSHTFRKGERGGWRTYFTREQIALFDEVAAPCLKRIGYS